MQNIALHPRTVSGNVTEIIRVVDNLSVREIYFISINYFNHSERSNNVDDRRPTFQRVKKYKRYKFVAKWDKWVTRSRDRFYTEYNTKPILNVFLREIANGLNTRPSKLIVVDSFRTVIECEWHLLFLELRISVCLNLNVFKPFSFASRKACNSEKDLKSFILWLSSPVR